MARRKATPAFMTRTKFAEHRRVTKQAVSRWVKKGYVILTDDYMVDVEQSDYQLDGRPDVYRGGITSQRVRFFNL